MTQTAKAQEPSMEEILASIRRIIADDDAGKPANARLNLRRRPSSRQRPRRQHRRLRRSKPAAPPMPKPATPAAAANSQDEIDAMLAELDGPPKATPKPAASQPAGPDVLDLTESMTTPHAGARSGTELPHHRCKS